MHWSELIGYLGSVFIALSLWMSNIRKLRLFNMTGASLLAMYGLMIHAYPVIILNVFNVGVNIFFLRQIRMRKDYFTLLPQLPSKTPYLEKFLEFYQNDIRKYFPEFSWDKLEKPHAFFILRNLVPVGLFVYEPKTDKIIEIKLDYVIPDYRDFKNASFTYTKKQAILNARGYTMFEARTTVKEHREYLLKIGFVQDEKDENLFRREI